MKRLKWVRNQLIAGGRYNGLVELGEAQVLVVWFVSMEAEEVVIPALSELDVVGIGSDTNVAALQLVQSIRNFGFSA